MFDYDELAQEYGQHRRVHPEVLKTLLSTSQVNRNSKVLEVGCGTGNYIRAIHKATGASSWGIDPSEEMLTEAKTQSQEISFEQGQAPALNFEDNFFNFVFSVDVIHHLEQIPPYFSEIFRILKPGGLICTVTDSDEIIRNRRPLAFYFPETIAVDLERYPSTILLRKRMEDTGFRNIQQIRVEFPYELTDIQAYKDKAYSCLHLISDESYQHGLNRMETDLAQGPIQGNSLYLLLFGKKPDRIVYM